jgi:hypothetical protein
MDAKAMVSGVDRPSGGRIDNGELRSATARFRAPVLWKSLWQAASSLALFIAACTLMVLQHSDFVLDDAVPVRGRGRARRPHFRHSA